MAPGVSGTVRGGVTVTNTGEGLDANGHSPASTTYLRAGLQLWRVGSVDVLVSAFRVRRLIGPSFGDRRRFGAWVSERQESCYESAHETQWNCVHEIKRAVNAHERRKGADTAEE